MKMSTSQRISHGFRLFLAILLLVGSIPWIPAAPLSAQALTPPSKVTELTTPGVPTTPEKTAEKSELSPPTDATTSKSETSGSATNAPTSPAPGAPSSPETPAAPAPKPAPRNGPMRGPAGAESVTMTAGIVPIATPNSTTYMDLTKPFLTGENILLSSTLILSETLASPLKNTTLRFTVPNKYLNRSNILPTPLVIAGGMPTITHNATETFIDYKFASLPGGISLKAQVVISAQTFETPDGYTWPITATFLNETNEVIVPKIDFTPKFKVIEPKINKTILSGGTYTSNDNQTIYAGPTNPAKPGYTATDAKNYLTFAFQTQRLLPAGTTSSNSSFGTRRVRYEIVDTLPPGAVFDQDVNPGWTYDPVTRTATYIATNTDIDYTTSSAYSFSNKSYYLKLRFPDSKLADTYTNNMTVRFRPDKAAENEPVFESSDSINFKLSSTLPVSTVGKGVNPYQVIDHSEAKKNPVIWNLSVSNQSGDMPMDWVEFNDNDLDNRFKFTHIQRYSGSLKYDVFAKINNGAEDKIFSNTDLSTKQALPDGITAIRIVRTEGEIPAGSYAGIYLTTVLKDPSEWHYSATTSSLNTRKNTAVFAYKYKGIDTPITDLSRTSSISIKSYAPSLQISKGMNRSTAVLGDIVDVTLYGITNYYNAMLAPDTLRNVRYLDLLPKGMSYVPNSAEAGYTTTAAFPNSPTKDRYKKIEPRVITDFRGTKRNALVWDLGDIETANTNANGSNYFAGITFKMKINGDAEPGQSFNEFFITWDNNNPAMANPPEQQIAPDGSNIDTLDVDDDGNTTEKILYTRTPISFIPGAELTGIKLVQGSQDSYYMSQGGRETIGSDFSYEMRLNNLSPSEIKKMYIVDVLPHKGDTYLVADRNGNFHARDSEYPVYLRGPITTFPTATPVFDPAKDTALVDGYVFEYSKERPAVGQTVKSFYDSNVWIDETEAAKDWSLIKSFRITQKPGVSIAKEKGISFYVPTKTDQKGDLKHGQISYNSYAFSTTNIDYAEGAATSARILTFPINGKAFIDVDRTNKISASDAPLSGIKVKLLNEDGTPAKNPKTGEDITAVTDAKGEYVIHAFYTGKYRVTFEYPDGFGLVDKGSDSSVMDSHVDATTKQSDLFTVKTEVESYAKNIGFLFTKGNLEVRKSVLDGSEKPVPTATTDFTFQVEVDPSPLDITNPQYHAYTGAVDINGTSTPGTANGQFTLKHGGVARILDLPAGAAFRVKEVDSKGYEITPTSASYTGRILTTEQSFLFVNKAKGSLKLNNIWVNGPATATDPNITVTVKGPSFPEGKDFSFNAKNPLDLSGLVYGDYTFEVKNKPDNYESTVTANVTLSSANPAGTWTVTNTYKIPKDASATATKVWIGGGIPRPTITFKLFRQVGLTGTPEAATDAVLKTLVPGVTSVTWDGLERTNAAGQSYIFTVKEVDAAGNDHLWSPTNYKKAENGLKVTNSYVSPTEGSATATLEWIDGPTPKPTVHLKLYRKINHTNPTTGVTTTIDEEVPTTEAPLKTMSNGMSSSTWTKLTQNHTGTGQPYAFYVKEVDAAGNDLTPTNYSKTEEGMKVTNKYVIPKDAFATASKNWVGGSAIDRPTIWLKLYRQAGSNPVEEVPIAEASVKELTDGNTAVTWNQLSRTDKDGVKYVFSVKEVDAEGTNPAWKPANYIKTETGLSVENKYTPPNTASAKAELEWVGGPSPRPTVWFKLYRNIAGGVKEAVPVEQAPHKALSSGTSVTTWTGLTETDAEGHPYIFTVQEVDENGNDLTPTNYSKTENGLKVINSYVIPTDGAETAQKIWVNGSRPTIWFRLYRQIPGGTAEAVALDRAPIKKLVYPTVSVSWSGLDRTDADGKVYTFTVKECDENGLVSWAPDNYSKSESGLKVTNSYVPPNTGKAEAKVVWIGGPAQHETVYFKLLRTSDGVTYESAKTGTIVNGNLGEKDTPVIMMESGKENVLWAGLIQNTIDGKPYEFIVRQVDLEGNPLIPTNYSTEEEGLTVTNTYIIPKDKVVTATKKWEKGKGPRPDIWFKLYRNIEGGTPEPVDTAQAAIQKLSDGTLEVTWLKQERTDGAGKVYTFSVRECNEDGSNPTWQPENYVKAENGLQVTNSYKSPTDASAKATLEWVNGPDTHPVVYFKLYRQIEGGKLEEVPDLNPKILPDGTDNVNWTGLNKTDENGNPYSFSVIQVDAAGNSLTPENYTKDEVNLHVKNIYIPPKGNVTAEKEWIDGNPTRPDIIFKLYRKVDGGAEEPAPHGTINLSSGVLKATWNDVELTDIKGKTYTFSVKEVDGSGAETTPDNYVKTTNGLKITNTYNSPTNASATADLVWTNGPDEHPTVHLKLYRRVPGAEPGSFIVEEVPEDEAPPKKMVNGVIQHAWVNLTKTNKSAVPYEFFVLQVDEAGKPLTVENYEKKEEGLKVTNAYRSPLTEATTTLSWVDGPAAKPDTYIALYRKVEGGQEERVPDAELKLMKNGDSTHTWAKLDKTDIKGHPYTFFVKETDATGKPGEPLNYRKTENGMDVTNYYVPPSDGFAKLKKIWNDDLSFHPTVYFKLYRQVEDLPVEEVPLDEAPILVLKAPKSYEGIWTKLKKTDMAGREYTFSAKEVIPERDGSYVPGGPAGYSIHEDGLVITNSIIAVSEGTIKIPEIDFKNPSAAKPGTKPSTKPDEKATDAAPPMPKTGETNRYPLQLTLVLLGAAALLIKRKLKD